MAKYKLLTKKEPEKKLLISLPRKSGRGFGGRITVRHRGGGVKRLYRLVDFGQEKQGQVAKVVALEYDPYRTAFLMLLEYKDGQKSYQLAPHGIKIGDEIICQETAEIKIGNRMKLKNIPVGATVYNVELIPQRGGQLVKAAGTGANVLAHEGKYTNLALPSGEVRRVLGECFASIGQVSHPEKRFEKIGKAGLRRLKGWRPTVRGKAMIPASHPHGGGKGKAPIGLKHPKTPSGKPALGVKTRKRKWTDKYILKRRKS
jgi:large subunit ribosomal protein L2